VVSLYHSQAKRRLKTKQTKEEKKHTTPPPKKKGGQGNGFTIAKSGLPTHEKGGRIEVKRIEKP